MRDLLAKLGQFDGMISTRLGSIVEMIMSRLPAIPPEALIAAM